MTISSQCIIARDLTQHHPFLLSSFLLMSSSLALSSPLLFSHITEYSSEDSFTSGADNDPMYGMQYGTASGRGAPAGAGRHQVQPTPRRWVQLLCPFKFIFKLDFLHFFVQCLHIHFLLCVQHFLYFVFYFMTVTHSRECGTFSLVDGRSILYVPSLHYIPTINSLFSFALFFHFFSFLFFRLSNVQAEKTCWANPFSLFCS